MKISVPGGGIEESSEIKIGAYVGGASADPGVLFIEDDAIGFDDSFYYDSAAHKLYVTDLDISGVLTGASVSVGPDIVDIDSISFNPGGALQTELSAGNTFLLRAYDVDGAIFVNFATLTANNTPTMDLSDAVTKGGGNYIYRAGGTDVPVADGGTGSSTASGARTNLGLVIGTDVQAFDADLSALAALSSTGIAVRSASDTWVQRSIAGGTSISVSNGDGVSGNPTISVTGLVIGTNVQAFDADLSALAALSSFGFAVRTASNTWAQRVFQEGTSISIDDGDGISGDPIINVSGLVIDVDVQRHSAGLDEIAATDAGAGSNAGYLYRLSDGDYAVVSGRDLEIVEPHVETVAAPFEIEASDNKKLFTNEDATEKVHFLLPLAEAGLTFKFVVQDAFGMRIKAQSDDTIRLVSSVTPAAGYVESVLPGSMLELHCLNAIEWVGMYQGTWLVSE